MRDTLKEYAEMLFEEGFNPIPVNNEKVVTLPANSNYLYERRPFREYDYTTYGIGITGGVASEGLEVIDFDKHQGQDIQSIFESFVSDELVRNMINEKLVCVYKTPSGGYHILYRTKKLESCQKIAKWEDGELMIETKSGGGYVVCYPTYGYTHYGGAELLKISTIENAERDYLIDLARSYTKVNFIAKSRVAGGKEWGKWDDNTAWGKFNKDGEDEVKRLLEKRGWSYISSRKLDGVELWMRPGKIKGISATFGKFKNMFYNFSGAKDAEPFEQLKAYTPTDVLMLLKFGGDWYKTKEYLLEKYDMNPVIYDDDKIIRMPFPIHVFPANVQYIINAMNDGLNYSKDFLSVSFMFTIASVNGNSTKLRVKNGWIAPTVFWFAVVGEPGTMKSHPISTMIEPLKDIDKYNKSIYDNEIKEWEADEKKGRKPGFKQIIVTDYTLESLHEIHNRNTRGLGLYRDELVGFLGDMNKYRKGSDEQFWLESFNNKSYIINRVTKDPVLIDNTMINIIGSIQPQVLANVVANNADNGLVDRFLFTSAESEIYPLSLNDVDMDVIRFYTNSIHTINAASKYDKEEGPTLLEMSKEALFKMIEIDTRLCEIQRSDDETNGIKNYINKMKTYLPRFALLLFIIDYFYDENIADTMIELDHMNRAEHLVNYFINSARGIFNASEKTNEITVVNRIMKQQGMTKAEQIKKLHQKGYSGVDIAKIIKSPASYVSKVLSNSK